MIKTIITKLNLTTPFGIVNVPAQLNYDENDRPLSEIKVVYDNVEYSGKGKDYLWVDTFADLQKKLPDDVKIACCMTCRHGNMCPFGNLPNLLFCTKDIFIGNKNDMCDVFIDDGEEGREVESCNYCADFVYQSEDYYTYNDYLYHLGLIDF